MEGLASIKRFKGKELRTPLMECKRVFNLPQQYPSTVKHLKRLNNSLVMRKNVEANNVSNNISEKQRTLILLNDIKTVRLKTQNGRDLGEIKVKFIPRNEIFKEKIPSNISPVFLSIKNSLQNLDANLTENDKVCSNFTTDIPKTDAKKKLLHKPFILKHNVSVGLCNSNAKDTSCNIESSSANQSNSMKLQDPWTSKNPEPSGTKAGNSLLKHNNHSDCTKETEEVNAFKIKKQIDESDCETTEKLQNYSELIESKFPIVKCKKLKITDNRVDLKDLDKSIIVTANSDKVDDPDIRQRNISPPSEKIHDAIATEKFLYKRSGDSIAIAPNNENKGTNIKKTWARNYLDHTRYKRYKKRRQYLLDPFLNKKTNHIELKSNTICTEDSSAADNNEESINDVPDTDKIPSYWNVIEEALIKVRDTEVRSKALKALSNCRSSIEKQILNFKEMTHEMKEFFSKNKKSVSDSESQTDLSGPVKSDNPLTIDDIAYNTKTVNEMDCMLGNGSSNIRSTYSNVDNKYLFPRLSTPSPVNSIPELDLFFNDYFRQNADVNKVMQVLSIPYLFHKKVLVQLQKDFEAMHQWDENGMLNIHRAVMDNNLRELQRLLVILEAAKMNIDVVTDDGLSALELAVKVNASKDIVTCLLKAGAKPAATEPVHESAVILACKQSSLLLAEILKYVKNGELLNRVDTTGFAPLHYCTFNENTDGVVALIEAGADINVGDCRSGRTAFFHAIEQNNLTVAHKLLEYGADVNVPNFAGQTVLHIVDEAKSLSLRAALKQIVI